MINYPKSSRGMGLRAVIFIISLILVIASIFYTTKLQDYARLVQGTTLTTDGSVNAVSFSQDGSLTYLGMRDNKVIALDQNGKTIWEFHTDGPILDMKTNGDYLYVSDDSRYVHVLDHNGNQLSSTKVGYRPTTVAGSGDGSRILTGTTMSAMKNRFQLYDSNGEQIYSLDPLNIISDVYYLDDSQHGIFISRN